MYQNKHHQVIPFVDGYQKNKNKIPSNTIHMVLEHVEVLVQFSPPNINKIFRAWSKQIKDKHAREEVKWPQYSTLSSPN